jgi:hypothetical protein
LEKYSSFHKAWLNFTENMTDDAGNRRYQPPHVPDHFYQYAQYLIELGYASAVAYMSRAYDLCAIVNVSENAIKTGRRVLADIGDWELQMERARTRVKELLTITIQQAKPFRLDDAAMMAPHHAAPFLIALSSGCRPKALYNCSFNSYKNCSNTGLTRVVLADVPRDKFCDSRIIRMFCTCMDAKTTHVFCPIHGQSAIGNFELPLKQNVLTRAIKGHYLDETAGYSAYSARRATSCAMAQLVFTEEGKHMKNALTDYPSCKARINAQFGWCPKSNMILHYCKGSFPLTPREKAFYYPLYMFLRYGLTQDQLGTGFIFNREGDALPPPSEEDSADPLIGPNTRSSEVDTKDVPMFKMKGKKIPLLGESAVIAAERAGAKSQPSSSSADGNADLLQESTRAPAGEDQGSQKPKRGRKKGGMNRPKDVIVAEKASKADKKKGRPTKSG